MCMLGCTLVCPVHVTVYPGSNATVASNALPAEVATAAAAL
jgi:hypothetical protein